MTEYVLPQHANALIMSARATRAEARYHAHAATIASGGMHQADVYGEMSNVTPAVVPAMSASAGGRAAAKTSAACKRGHAPARARSDSAKTQETRRLRENTTAQFRRHRAIAAYVREANCRGGCKRDLTGRISPTTMGRRY